MRDGLAHVSVYTDDTDDDDDYTNLFTYMDYIIYKLSPRFSIMHYLKKTLFLLASKFILKKVTASFCHYF